MTRRRGTTPSEEGIVWFVDRSLGRIHVPEALRRAGEQVRVHDDHFSPTTPDVEWLEHVGRSGWVVLTKDQNIRRTPHERAALVGAGVRAFVVAGKGLSGPDLARRVVLHLPRMRHETQRRAQAFVALVTGSGVRVLRVR